ncbi:hypothetical protein [Paracoccus sp. (in: a-proteobacteria)]|uniref:hypothetical protein n=1 Tax=Paracoccus sp. TaxID=267 RepID=UPI00396C3257
MKTRIDLYPGDLCLEDVPAQFHVDDVHLNRRATLDRIKVGQFYLDREQVKLMVGTTTVWAIEKDILERLQHPELGSIVAE